MELTAEYIVVGSGATGAIAAQTLVESGVSVAMLDVGISDKVYQQLLPDKDFLAIRKTDKQQHDYFLGKKFEGIVWNSNRVGSQLTPPRNHLVEGTDSYSPIVSESLKPMESFAYGGLGAGWGTGCFVFSDQELEKAGLDPNEIKPAYQVVADRIGISGENDDAGPYCLGELNNIMPPVHIEKSINAIFSKYKNNKNKLNKKGIFVGRSALAVLTEDKHNRKKIAYKDMDYWSDKDQSAYRSWMTIEELKNRPNFTYYKNCLVLSFKEYDAYTEVTVKDISNGEIKNFYCKKLVLAAGVISTARIVLRSFNAFDKQVPVICNPYTYIPCVQLKLLGTESEQYKTGFCQLIMYLDENKDNADVPIAALFSYRSLLLYKLIKEVPLNFSDGRILMQYLQSAITIAGVHHPEVGSSTKTIKLVKNVASYTGDALEGEYILSNEEKKINKQREKKIKNALVKLGCIPLKTIETPLGASVHYAGTLPFSQTGEPFTLQANGLLNGTKNVFVADGSGFNYLPAKGLTLTLMANAHCVAINALKK